MDLDEEEYTKTRTSIQYIDKFSKLANECVMTKFCHNCFEEYTLSNSKYEGYPVCKMCACKIAVSIQAEVMASVMAKR